jgi:hypothetical protein
MYKSRRVLHTRIIVLAGLHIYRQCHGGCINFYYQYVVPNPYRKWYHESYYIIVWVLIEIVYRIFIGIIASMIAGMIVGIGLQCRRDRQEAAVSKLNPPPPTHTHKVNGPSVLVRAIV